MTRRPHDIAASVRQRLLDLSRKRDEEFQVVLTRFALERLLYRLTVSPYSGDFILKGAMLFTLWSGEPHRATWDLDLLGRGESSIARMERIFRDVCRVKVPDDGLSFEAEAVRGGRIREDQEYEGIRVRIDARLGMARIVIQVDVGFGDVVLPRPVKVDFPTALDFPAPRLKAYPRESVVAEKFQAMVLLGMANSRMKDFYDLWSLARIFPFKGSALARAIKATFNRRRTPIPPEVPVGLSPAFFEDGAKPVQWKAFLRRGRLTPDAPPLRDVIGVLRAFLLPPKDALVKGEPFTMSWPAGGPWGS